MTCRSTPTLSVLMGIYYQKENLVLLERSIRSIQNQTFSDFELLICDDGSSDEATTYIDELAANDSRIRLIRKGNLLSLPEKLNACLLEAKGKWIARMDDDDFSHPERFSIQLKYLIEHPQTAFIGCNVNLWRNGTVVGKRILPGYPTVQDFYFTQPYIHPTLIFKKEALIAVNGYSQKKSCLLCEDYDLLLRLYGAGFRGENLQQELFDYTIPTTAKGNRKMHHRWNETVTRFQRFKELGVLLPAFPYVIKPLVVGLIPEPVLKRIKGLPL